MQVERDPGRVLIVDDQPEIVAGMQALLELDGLVVFHQASLITLPFRIRECHPDVILLDLGMPALSGTALFGGRGAHDLLRTDALIILFSGRDSRELSRLTEELGADGYISKADDVNDSIRRIHSWIAHRRVLRATQGGKRNATHPAARPAL